MATIFNGITWYVAGVDSVSTHDENNHIRIEPLWCRHSTRKADTFTETDKHIICNNCGRQFQRIHPVVAEMIARERDKLEMQIAEMINNA